MSYRISRGALVLVWIITVLLAFIFMNAGIGKFGGAHNFWTVLFQHWGLPHWFQLAIGVEEVIAAVLLVWPKTARLGAILVLTTMIGAMAVGIAHAEFRHFPGEVLSLVFATVIFAARQSMQAGDRGANHGSSNSAPQEVTI